MRCSWCHNIVQKLKTTMMWMKVSELYFYKTTKDWRHDDLLFLIFACRSALSYPWLRNCWLHITVCVCVCKPDTAPGPSEWHREAGVSDSSFLWTPLADRTLGDFRYSKVYLDPRHLNNIHIHKNVYISTVCTASECIRDAQEFYNML